MGLGAVLAGVGAVVSARLVAGRSNGQHYTLWSIDDIGDVRGVFGDLENVDYTLNWLFVGTSGVHGTYLTLDDLDEMLTRPEDDETRHTVTVLIVSPRIVRMEYGDIPISREDIPYLRECVRKTLAGVRPEQGRAGAARDRAGGGRTGGGMKDTTVLRCRDCGGELATFVTETLIPGGDPGASSRYDAWLVLRDAHHKIAERVFVWCRACAKRRGVE